MIVRSPLDTEPGPLVVRYAVVVSDEGGVMSEFDYFWRWRAFQRARTIAAQMQRAVVDVCRVPSEEVVASFAPGRIMEPQTIIEIVR